MSAPVKLNEEQRAQLLPALHASGWTLVEGRDAIYKVGCLPVFCPPVNTN